MRASSVTRVSGGSAMQTLPWEDTGAAPPAYSDTHRPRHRDVNGRETAGVVSILRMRRRNGSVGTIGGTNPRHWRCVFHQIPLCSWVERPIPIVNNRPLPNRRLPTFRTWTGSGISSPHSFPRRSAMSQGSTMIPHLVVKGAAKACEFYKKAFGAIEL